MNNEDFTGLRSTGLRHNPINEDIYYKGVSDVTLNELNWTGIIKPRKLRMNRYGVYVSKSKKLAGTYGDYILELNLKNRIVEPSGHSNQFVVLGILEHKDISRIIPKEEEVKG